MRPAARRFHVPADRRPAPGRVSGARLVDEKGRPPGERTPWVGKLHSQESLLRVRPAECGPATENESGRPALAPAALNLIASLGHARPVRHRSQPVGIRGSELFI